MDLINSIKMIYGKKQTVFITIISLLVLCIVFYFIFLPALRQSRLLSQRIKEKKTDLSNLKISSGEYELLENQLNQTKEQLEILKNRLFWERDISRFLNELTQLASGLQIEFVSLKPGVASLPSEKGKKESQGYLVAQTSISVTIKGSYDDLVKLLSRIEKADKFIKIDVLEIESDRSNIYKHNMNIDLSIFSKEEG